MDIEHNYINGGWKHTRNLQKIDILNPADETVIGSLAMGSREDVDHAVQAANAAFPDFSMSNKDYRIALLERILELYESRYDEIAAAITLEMGAPVSLARDVQAYTGIEHFEATIKALKSFEEVTHHKGYSLHHEAIGVCGLIAPWNWPINQVACKVAPALASGCTIVLKPSEFSPLSAKLFAQIIHDADVPAGVFNMIYGDGVEVGATLAAHPNVDMVSFTGSTRAGIAVAQSAANTVKRVSQELGGKSPIIITGSCNIDKALEEAAWLCMENTGQSCNAGTRLLVPSNIHDMVIDKINEIVMAYKVGDPQQKDTDIGPLANRNQYEKVSGLIREAIDSGLQVACGGETYPHQPGYFVQPTVFANLKNDDLIASEEVFGPVLAVIPYNGLEDAIQIANDTPYGLSAYIYSNDDAEITSLTRALRAGMVHVNGAPLCPDAPFGGYKQSGNGREWGLAGLHEYYETKAVMR